jgi:HPt (histidine-containing phosphotransfer) domain-containing protein
MNEPVIDETTFRDLQEAAGAEFVGELVDTFLDEARGMLAALHEARSAGDAERFRRAAHSLKSNGLTFGATALADAARALELGGIGSTSAIDAVQDEFVAAARRLKELRDA